MIVAIDNNILIHLVSDRAVHNNLETFLHQYNATLLIPTPVIAEFTAHDFNKRRMQLLSYEHNKVLTGIFDKKAALICGELSSKLHKDILNNDKQRVKVDLQIIAIALSNGAEILLSEDKGVLRSVKDLELNLKVYSRKDIKIGLDLFDSN
ncbi:PIN domain-containing protein [Acinetobacter schindleri]|uniref:type II toxin-antitoxin system VapC family toxin n=1 Tax=Acinetobacter TaxID=469 RepID=UPI001F352A11|nr:MULTISPECIES: PIN domain-containing protein [Acinetobacter]UIZ94910.1 PIN domain-containing protein [Acinetobacter johnsonii]WDE17173.1 PIN domain-containing protein [Acinetobacter schindleri]